MSEQDYIQLTFFPVDSPANLSALPGNDEAKKMTVTSGRRCLELSKNCGPLGLLEKTLLGSSIWGSTLRLLTWKHKVTPAGRLYFQLAASAPRISDTESQLWATPTASDGAQGGIIGKNDSFHTTANGTLRKVNQNGTDGSVGLGRLVRMWATPTASDSEGTTGGNRFSLRTDVQGQLNPEWVEALMGFPAGWTNLDGQLPLDSHNICGSRRESSPD